MMTTMTTLLKDAIEAKGTKLIGSATAETEHGIVTCTVQTIDGNTRAFRKNWRLNHKPMSAKKMETLIGA